MASSDFANDVRAGLGCGQKRLSCRFFYDNAGSTLFEDICAVDEYYIPEAEAEIFSSYARTIIDQWLDQCPTAGVLAELGSGSAVKTRTLIEAILCRQDNLRYVPIDISPAALEVSRVQLERDYSSVSVVPLEAEYRAGVGILSKMRAEPKLILWLGSNIGNLNRFDAAEFVGSIGRAMKPVDRLLLGIDLKKDAAVLHAAYNDSQGVTARFNKNILERINRDLGGHFNLEAFEHSAVYNAEAGCIEMYLVSTVAQEVAIDALALKVGFDEGEAIHTEDSYKYSLDDINDLVASAGMRRVGLWTDAKNRFTEVLLAK